MVARMETFIVFYEVTEKNGNTEPRASGQPARWMAVTPGTFYKKIKADTGAEKIAGPRSPAVVRPDGQTIMAF